MTDKVNNFYQLEFRRRRGVLFLNTYEKYNDLEVFKGIITPDLPLKTFIVKGTSYLPYAYLPDSFNIALRKDIIERLQECQVTGWKSYPIHIKDSDFIYYGLQITGRCGPLTRPAQSGYVMGMQFAIETRDGSDFFSPADTGSIIFTEKARTFFLTNKFFDNEEVKNIEHIQWYSVGAQSNKH